MTPENEIKLEYAKVYKAYDNEEQELLEALHSWGVRRKDALNAVGKDKEESISESKKSVSIPLIHSEAKYEVCLEAIVYILATRGELDRVLPVSEREAILGAVDAAGIEYFKVLFAGSEWEVEELNLDMVRDWIAKKWVGKGKFLNGNKVIKDNRITSNAVFNEITSKNPKKSYTRADSQNCTTIGQVIRPIAAAVHALNLADLREVDREVYDVNINHAVAAGQAYQEVTDQLLTEQAIQREEIELLKAQILQMQEKLEKHDIDISDLKIKTGTIEDQIIELLKAGKRGVDICAELGVSKFKVSRVKKKAEQEGLL